MTIRSSAYWWCQLGGWLFYTLALGFFSWIFDHEISQLFVHRLLLSISLGFLFTHLLRYTILKLKLLPPLFGNQWILIFSTVLLICCLYSFVNSSVVEWLAWYDPKIKASIEKRFLYNMMNDSPIILVWASIYYLWHYKIGRAHV